MGAACSASPTEINPQHRLSRSLISLAGLDSYLENLYPIWETHYSEQQQNRDDKWLPKPFQNVGFYGLVSAAVTLPAAVSKFDGAASQWESWGGLGAL